MTNSFTEALFGPVRTVEALHFEHPDGRLEVIGFAIVVPEGEKITAMFTCTGFGTPVIERVRTFQAGKHRIEVADLFTAQERQLPDRIYFGAVKERLVSVQGDRSAPGADPRD